MTTATTYGPCDECGSPTDEQQRFCVACGTNLRRPDDPVSRYFASSTATRRIARAAPVAAAAGRPHRRRNESLLIAAAFALLPIAAGIGVAVGRGDGEADANLLAALKSQKAPIVQVGSGGATGAVASTAVSAITSDFSLDKGYVVQLDTIAAADADADAVDEAKADAKEKGAEDVGVINPSDFLLSPDPSGDFVIYSGEFKDESDAKKALEDLEKEFPKAEVVKVSPSATGAKTVADAGADVGPTAEDVPGYKATPAPQEEARGKEIVERIQQETGKTYVESQRNLPQEIVIP